MSECKSTEIDFITFGVPPNYEFLEEVRATLAAFPMSSGNDNYAEHILAANRLLLVYSFVWNQKARGHIRIFFQCAGMQMGLSKNLELKKEIDNSSHKLCILAAKILCEYAIYQQHWNATRNHIKIQRNLLSSRRKFYTSEIEKRDGYLCRRCKITENLQLDHIKPVSRGGFTDLANLQFLCGCCNRAKSNRTLSS